MFLRVETVALRLFTRALPHLSLQLWQAQAGSLPSRSTKHSLVKCRRISRDSERVVPFSVKLGSGRSTCELVPAMVC